MKISKSLRPPDNWKDFERLCKKLWGEIWDCPEITMNGRNGQNQNGIDISGIPKGEDSYYGIQCKGKDLYTHKQLTEKEILEEIEKAKTFEPALKKMYFTTTAVKDAKIESFVRKKNLEHIKQGIFEVYLYSWEDIVDLIKENKGTYDYYLNSNSFKTNQSVQVTFKNGETEMTVYPKFTQKSRISKTRYEELEKEAAKYIPKIFTDFQEDLWNNHGILDMGYTPVPKRTEFNRSFFDSTLLVTNDGSEPLEHWKLILLLPEQISEATHKNYEKKKGYTFFHNSPTIQFDTYIDKENNLIELEPRKKILVSDDSFSSDPIFLKAYPEDVWLELHWKFMSKTHKQEGTLTVNIQADINYKRIKVDDDSPLLLDEKKRVTIEDFIETVDDK
ncbi:hypothetical protein [Marinirhabdus gelatinilytica]|uniref:Restriction endonuclease n=1 Tax=Marinirhabdus gelatinilytica TaxID=1703343 RepID=A0A370QLJ7_9FLAO|nr:hypothetical protein [Marinirhabdus gelatinilytica]RDK89211.1 hypothetical protein C8D94_1011092 [Marinirhabdus gelatinilytica]